MGLGDVTHTSAQALARFEALPLDAKLREIWLNGRETNGHVAEALEGVGQLEAKVEVNNGRLTVIEHREIRRTAVLVFFLVSAPFVIFGLDWIREVI